MHIAIILHRDHDLRGEGNDWEGGVSDRIQCSCVKFLKIPKLLKQTNKQSMAGTFSD